MLSLLAPAYPRYYDSHKRSRFFIPGSLPDTLELEEVHSRDSSSSRRKALVSSSNSIVSGSEKVQSNSDLISTNNVKPKQGTDVGGMLSADTGRPKVDRRNGSTSSSSVRSYSDEGTPSAGNIGSLMTERENMRTPRPLTADPSPRSQQIPLPDSSFQQRRKEASDATLEGNALGVAQKSQVGREEAPSEYPSDSLGRMSVTSSGYGARPSASDSLSRPSNSPLGKAKKKKTVAPPELLVIVRPPPSKQVNPLNLQIQLVIPQVNASTTNTTPSRSSFDSSRGDDVSIAASQSSSTNGGGSNSLAAMTGPPGHKLNRSPSTHSTRSSRSEASSGGLSSFSSSSISRRVTPLYNLNFHNIVATTITDAGTDDKVAKFGKRNVEIDGFGQLEPHELIMGVNDLVTLQRRRSSIIDESSAQWKGNNNSGSDFQSPDAVSEVSHPHSGEFPSMPPRGSDLGHIPIGRAEPPTSFDAMSPEAKNPEAAGLGGKLMRGFKRFSLSAGSGGNALNKTGTNSIRSGSIPPDNSASTNTNIFSKMTTAAASKLKEAGTALESTDEQSEIVSARESDSGVASISHALGLDIPQLVAGGGLRADGRRTEGYYWTVRKWNRRSAQEEQQYRDPRLDEAGSNPILNSVWKRFNIVNRMGGQEDHPPSHAVPVRFEWRRNTERRKSSAVSSGHARAATESRARSQSRRQSIGRSSVDGRGGGEGNAASVDLFRSNLRPPKSGQHSRPSSVYSSGSVPRRSLDAGSQAGSHMGSEDPCEDSDPEDSETTWSCHLVLGPTTRIPIGSLTPTPHHPKLIGQLTIPFPLPDLSQSGLGADRAGLTREELKDIISVTCLFVVIREGFGAIGRKKKTNGTK